MENETITNTKKCDDCGDEFIQEHIVKHFQGHYFICRNCIAYYRRKYKKREKINGNKNIYK